MRGDGGDRIGGYCGVFATMHQSPAGRHRGRETKPVDRGHPMKIRAIVLIACVALLSNVPVRATPPLHDLDAYVRQTMQQWQVPGMAVAVVKDGKVVLARGYGVRELGKLDKVDADTLFDIGSNTKSFTAAALGTLVAAGKLDWDAHVV